MDKKKITGCISRVAELAEGWETQDRVDPIERDLALEMLRTIYAEVKFGVSEPAVDQEHTVSSYEAVKEAVAPIEVLPAEPAPPAVEEKEVIVEQEHKPVPAPLFEPKPGPETVPEREPYAAHEATDLPQPISQPEVQAEPVQSAPRRVNPDVIRSLYGEDTPSPVRTGQEREVDPVQVRKEPEAAVEPQQRETIATPAAATLGDVMNGSRQTLGETLQNGKQDMASKLAAAERPELRQSIGLNDKFLMIRDLFDGNADAYDLAIAHLDSFTDLDDAVIWIHETYNWSADSDGVKLLIDLLERKLG